jgi:hypothetical protein
MANNAEAPEGKVGDRGVAAAPERHSELNLVSQAGSVDALNQNTGAMKAEANNYMVAQGFPSGHDVMGLGGNFGAPPAERAGGAPERAAGNTPERAAGTTPERAAGAPPEREAGVTPERPGVPGSKENSAERQPSGQVVASLDRQETGAGRQPGDKLQPTDQPPNEADDPNQHGPEYAGTPQEIRDRMPATAAAAEGQGGWTPAAAKEFSQEMNNAMNEPGADQGTVVSRIGNVADAFGKNPDGSPRVSVTAHMDSNQIDTRISASINHDQRDANKNLLHDISPSERPPSQPDAVINGTMRGGRLPRV